MFCFRLEIPFLCKIGPKIQNYQFKRNFGIKTNLNMRNSMMMFTFSVFDHNTVGQILSKTLVEKFETKTNSNTHNSIVVSILTALE